MVNLCSTCAIPSRYRFLNKGIYLLHLQCTSLLENCSLVCKKDTGIMAMGFLGGSVVKNLPDTQEKWVRSLGWEDPWRRAWQSTSVSLPGEFHGWISLVSYSPRGCKEWDRTEATEHASRQGCMWKPHSK